MKAHVEVKKNPTNFMSDEVYFVQGKVRTWIGFKCKTSDKITFVVCPFCEKRFKKPLMIDKGFDMTTLIHLC